MSSRSFFTGWASTVNPSTGRPVDLVAPWFRHSGRGSFTSCLALSCCLAPREQVKASPVSPGTADLTGLAVVHYDEADPKHPGRWRVSFALPGVKFPKVGRLGDWNEGIGWEDAFLARPPGLELLGCKSCAGYLAVRVRINRCPPNPSSPRFRASN